MVRVRTHQHPEDWYATSIRLDGRGARQLRELQKTYGLRSINATVAKALDVAFTMEREHA
jgi:hypothetical protein